MTRQVSDLDKVIIGACLFILLGLAVYLIMDISAFDASVKASCNYNLTHNLAFNDLCFKVATSEELTASYSIMILILIVITYFFLKYEKKLREKVFKNGSFASKMESDKVLK